MSQEDPFHGPKIPAPWEPGSAQKKGLLTPTWRCPDCDSLELSPFALMMNHGWNPAPGLDEVQRERPCLWALEEEGLALCLRQLRAIGGRSGVENGILPPKFPGVWQAKGGAHKLIQIWAPPA